VSIVFDSAGDAAFVCDMEDNKRQCYFREKDIERYPTLFFPYASDNITQQL